MGGTNSSNRLGPKPKRGDWIEIFCDGFQHWAVYVGRGYVVHLTGVDTEVPGFELILMENVQGYRAVVKKELLRKVAAGYKYRVNNKGDGQRGVRSPEEIVQIALAMVGQEWPYSLTQENCELHDGEPISEQKRVNVGPNPGDLIEFFRGSMFTPHALRYQHWAVYVGDGYVVHLTSVDGSGGKMIGSMSGGGPQAVVKKELLSKVAAGCKFQVNNMGDSRFPPLPPEEIVQNALWLVGQERPYSLTQKNCEHFVTELRYGVARSGQVEHYQMIREFISVGWMSLQIYVSLYLIKTWERLECWATGTSPLEATIRTDPSCWKMKQ